MKTTSLRIVGAVLGLGMLGLAVPGIRADDATNNGVSQAQEDNDAYLNAIVEHGRQVLADSQALTWPYGESDGPSYSSTAPAAPAAVPQAAAPVVAPQAKAPTTPRPALPQAKLQPYPKAPVGGMGRSPERCPASGGGRVAGSPEVVHGSIPAGNCGYSAPDFC